MRLENRKIVPLTALQVRINLPEILEPSNQEFSKLHESAPQEGVVVRSTSMRWYERLTWAFDIPLITRGHFQLARIDLKSGDLFGVYRRERTDDTEHTLWVYRRSSPFSVWACPGCVHRESNAAASGCSRIQPACRRFATIAPATR